MLRLGLRGRGALAPSDAGLVRKKNGDPREERGRSHIASYSLGKEDRGEIQQLLEDRCWSAALCGPTCDEQGAPKQCEVSFCRSHPSPGHSAHHQMLPLVALRSAGAWGSHFGGAVTEHVNSPALQTDALRQQTDALRQQTDWEGPGPGQTLHGRLDAAPRARPLLLPYTPSMAVRSCCSRPVPLFASAFFASVASLRVQPRSPEAAFAAGLGSIAGHSLTLGQNQPLCYQDNLGSSVTAR
ncbi:unnamed protein product, partial [Rangifer tarandus platyrhynchus]